MTYDTMDHIRAKYSWVNEFSTCIFSCEHHIVKPNEEIYEICLDALDVDPYNCIFLDDTERNVNTAHDLGIRAIHFQNEHDFWQKLLMEYKV